MQLLWLFFLADSPQFVCQCEGAKTLVLARDRCFECPPLQSSLHLRVYREYGTI